MWHLVRWPGIEPRPPALGAQSLTHWTTREVPINCSLNIPGTFPTFFCPLSSQPATTTGLICLLQSSIITVLENSWPTRMKSLKIILPLDWALLILAGLSHMSGDWLNVDSSWMASGGTIGLSSLWPLILQQASLDLTTWQCLGTLQGLLRPELESSSSLLSPHSSG